MDEERAPRAVHPQHDLRFKIVMGHAWAVCDFLVHFTDLPFRHSLRVDHLQELPQEWIRPDMKARIADKVWLIRDEEGEPRLVLLLECQSSYDPTMSLRMAEYLTLLGENLAKNEIRRQEGLAVPILPAVYHVGPRPWPTPWYYGATAPDLPQAVILRPGLTVDIHAYAQRKPPPDSLVSCMITLELGRHQLLRNAGASAEILRFVREELRPLLERGPDLLKQDFAAYLTAGFHDVISDWKLSSYAYFSMDVWEGEMVTLSELLQRARAQGQEESRVQGQEEGRVKTLLAERTEYVSLYWDEETGQAFKTLLSQTEAASWPSLRDLHSAYQAGRNPLQLLGASDKGRGQPAQRR